MSEEERKRMLERIRKMAEGYRRQEARGAISGGIDVIFLLEELDRVTAENRWLRAAHLLLANDEAFIGQPGGSVFFHQAGAAKDGTPVLAINLNDTFAYACADCEEFEYADAEELWNIAKTDGWPGLVRWAQGRRALKGELAEPISPTTKGAVEALKERDAALEQVRVLTLGLRNVRALAKRLHKTDPEVAGHFLRFCDEAGVQDSLLRGDAATAKGEKP